MFSNPLILDILDYLDLNLFRKVTINELSNTFHFNKDYLMRLFKKEIGATIIDYMNYKRIFSSLDSLRESSSILNVSLRYGFYSQEYYSEMFHKLIGVSPTIYRLYLNYDPSVDEDTYYLIQKNVIFLELFFKKIEAYRRNIPSKDSVIKLSIFK